MNNVQTLKTVLNIVLVSSVLDEHLRLACQLTLLLVVFYFHDDLCEENLNFGFVHDKSDHILNISTFE